MKNFFINEGIENAFDQELKSFLNEINIEEVPSNFTKIFMKGMLNEEKIDLTKILRLIIRLLHQSRLLNYFKPELTK